MKFVRRPNARLCGALAIPLAFSLSGEALRIPKAQAQDFTAPLVAPTLQAPAQGAKVPVERLTETVRGGISRGRAQFDAGDERSVLTLRDAAQSALTALSQVAGENPLTATFKSLPSDAVTSGLAQVAGEAHFHWGVAADRFARRDESITALTRALRLSRAVAGPPEDSGILRRDAARELSQVLRGGLPLIAPNDVLDTIAQIAPGGFWTAKRSGFDPMISAQVGAAPFGKEEFLVTDGDLFLPVAASGPLSRTPPLYARFPADQLPGSLQLSKMVAGYEKQKSGPNRGQWRQIVRVLYASPLLTKNRRDDLPRARALCEQFLKVHSLFENALGATNLYARGDRDEGVTTLWLLEVSALWPEDDEDPAVLAQLGAQMPGINTGPLQQGQPKTTALVRPWMALAGQVESSAGEIMFWKSSLARPETEWVRELFHEYGHVALPPFGGFRPPLEPYGNGVLGETLGALWAAPQSKSFGAPEGRAPDSILAQVNTQALPALQGFLKAGPNSSLQSGGNEEGRRYLQGLVTYLERVYGAKMLGRAFTPLSNRAAKVSNVAARRGMMNARTLLDSLPATWNNSVWNNPNGNDSNGNNPNGNGSTTKTLPIWLPGALSLPRSAQNLVARDSATLARGARSSALLWVPKGTESLLIEGSGVAQMRAIGLPSTRNSKGLRVFFGGKSGWQSFFLQAGADAQISAARFEKK